MKIHPPRVFIYPKDVSRITGRSVRNSYHLLNQIRKFYHKLPHQPVTLKEFCDYMGISQDDALRCLDA